MTQRIAAINAFRPRLDLAKTVQKPELVRQLARATGMNEGFADQALLNGLNTPDTYSGDIINRENIGKTPAELIALWNEAHPEDPVSE